MLKFYSFFSKCRANYGKQGGRILFLVLLAGGIGRADGQNLILNPGADIVPVLSNHWIRSTIGTPFGTFDPAQGGDWYLNNGNTYANPSVISVDGSHYFSAGSDPNFNTFGNFDQIEQTIDLTAYTGTDGSFTFTGYMSLNGGDDAGGFSVRFLSGSTVKHLFDTSFVATDGSDVAYHLITHSWNMAAADNITSAVVAMNATGGGLGPVQVFSDGLGMMNGPVLPLNLLDFTAVQQPDNTVALVWQTAQEQNSHYIEIQRSGDGKNYAAIGQVPAAGNSKLVKDYSFTDEKPLMGNGFYRLRLVDLDGSFKYSKIVEVRSSGTGKALEVYNNPFYDQISIKLSSDVSDQLSVTLTDMSGRIYLRQAYRAQAGNNFLNMYPSPGIAKGVYLLNVKGAHTNQTIKLLKQQ